MAGLACPKCGSRNTKVVNKGEIGSLKGFVGETIISKLLDIIADYYTKYIVCKDCGNYEKIN